MKKIKENNTLVFLIHLRANHQLREGHGQEAVRLQSVQVKQSGVTKWPARDCEAVDIANKIKDIYAD